MIDPDEVCPECGHVAALHFGPSGYGCDDCPSEECAPQVGMGWELQDRDS